VGHLPPGYLPLTAANGLGGLSAYTLAAATDVAAQNGQVPSMTTVSTTTSGPGSGSAATSAGSSGSGSFLPGTIGYAGGSTFGGAAGSSATAAVAGIHRIPPSKGLAFTVVHPGIAPGTTLWTGGSLLILGLALALAGVFAIPALFAFGRRRGRW
jgi:hypothetical protein